jgi:hypothetical protein
VQSPMMQPQAEKDDFDSEDDDDDDGRYVGMDKTKARLARKAELARASRKRKKMYFADLEDKVRRLTAKVEELKAQAANNAANTNNQQQSFSSSSSSSSSAPNIHNHNLTPGPPPAPPPPGAPPPRPRLRPRPRGPPHLPCRPR